MCGFTQRWEGKEDGGRNVKKNGRNTRCVVLYWEYKKGRKGGNVLNKKKKGKKKIKEGRNFKKSEGRKEGKKRRREEKRKR